MSHLWFPWVASALVLVILAIVLGVWVIKRGPSGILIDERGRYSLTHFQVVLWTLIVVSLLAGLFVARAVAGVPNALDFSIPDEVLIVMGISLGGGATATAIKAGKDSRLASRIAASNDDDRPRFGQIFLLEEGEVADRVIDVTKFQNFWFTLIVAGGFVVLTCTTNAGTAVADIVIPTFSGTLLTLLGISHAGYLAGKLPDRSGKAKGLTLDLRRKGAVPKNSPLASAAVWTYVPRNPKTP
jgi:hypothetical protein